MCRGPEKKQILRPIKVDKVYTEMPPSAQKSWGIQSMMPESPSSDLIVYIHYNKENELYFGGLPSALCISTSPR